MNSKKRAVELAQKIVSKKGADVQVFEMKKVASFTDFFVLATGTSTRHVKTLRDAAVKPARVQGAHALGVEGDPPGRWILVDLGDVVVHLFEAEARNMYSLEKLWGEAIPLELPPDPAARLAQASL